MSRFPQAGGPAAQDEAPHQPCRTNQAGGFPSSVSQGLPDCACRLVSSEEDAEGKKSFVYHINDGVYGSLGSVIFSNICPTPILPKVRRGPRLSKGQRSLLFSAKGSPSAKAPEKGLRSGSLPLGCSPSLCLAFPGGGGGFPLLGFE